MLVHPVGAPDATIPVAFRHATTGEGLTGLVYNAAGLVASYQRPRAARVAITLATQTVTGAHSDGGFVEIDGTNQKGLYRLDLPDAAVAVGASWVVVSLGGAANMLFEHTIIFLDPLPDVVSGAVVADAGNGTGTFKTDLTSSTTDAYKDCWVLFRSGNLAGQVKKCSAFNGSTKFVSVSTPFTGTPASTDQFLIVNR